jgi:hypothetical protein
MSLPYARTYDEAYLYISLRPCICGETEFEDRTSQTVAAGGVSAKRISGHCANCGRYREFTFRMSDESREISFEIRYGIGDEPSQLLDPGEWLGISDAATLAAQERLDFGELNENDDVTRVYYLLTSALAAVEETMKFLPGGPSGDGTAADGEMIPEGAFRSQADRLVFEAVPERFQRGRLTEERDMLRQRVVDFENKYGEEDDGA